MRTLIRRALSLALPGAPAAALAAVIGHMTPPEPLAEGRIATLPAASQGPWQAYLARSRALAAADQAALAAERGAGAAPADPPEDHNGGAGMPLGRPAAWYGAPQARHVADVIVSFQTPAGGWGKNAERSGPLRQPGQHWVPGGRSFVGTIDNNATTTELRFLARVQAQLPGAPGQPYRDAFLKGVRYLLDAQYPNGGFPQIYPLEGGYHDAITFNDDALVDVVELLAAVAHRDKDYGFVPPAVTARAQSAIDNALHLILATQVVAGGVRTAWGQQIDVLTLAPVGARNFEPASLVSQESAALLLYLMGLPEPSPQAVAAVHAGAAWLRQAALSDIAWTATSPEAGRRRIASPGAGPIWARYYQIEPLRQPIQPVFGDRDRSIHDDVNELSLERRNGYAWYGTRPAEALAAYAGWSQRHPLPVPAAAQ
jgi:PelA/Pel-15E family pectate lyase